MKVWFLFVIVVAGRNGNVNLKSNSSNMSKGSASGGNKASRNSIGYQYPNVQLQVYLFICIISVCFQKVLFLFLL